MVNNTYNLNNKNKKGIPIIIIHFGNSYYLNYSIGQAQYFNPNSDVIVIGDSTNKEKVKKLGAIHESVLLYYDSARKFEEVYVHMSVNSLFLEKTSFQRWLILRDYIKVKNITSTFLYIDSDVMLYFNVSDFEQKYFRGYDISVCTKFGPGVVYFKNYTIIDKFANMILDYYTNNKKLALLKREFIVKEFSQTKYCNAISDITLLNLFTSRNDIKYFENIQIRDNSIFDTHMAKNDGFLKDKNIKKIKFIDEKPYGFYLESNTWIQLLSLHFQGYYKRYMYRFYAGNPEKVPNKFVSLMEYQKSVLKRKVWKIMKFFKLR